MKKLEKSFKKYGDQFKQILRKGKYAVYQRTSKAGSRAFEVIKVSQHNGYKLGKNFIEPAEIYPGSSLWGIQGWTIVNKNDAEQQFNNLINGRKRKQS